MVVVCGQIMVSFDRDLHCCHSKLPCHKQAFQPQVTFDQGQSDHGGLSVWTTALILQCMFGFHILQGDGDGDGDGE